MAYPCPRKRLVVGKGAFADIYSAVVKNATACTRYLIATDAAIDHRDLCAQAIVVDAGAAKGCVAEQ